MSKWPDGTHKSMNNGFNWRTGEPSVFASDPLFRGKGKQGLSDSQLASKGRETAVNNGNDVSTIKGIGRVVIDRSNSKSFHVHRPAKRGL